MTVPGAKLMSETETALEDYNRVRRGIAFLSDHWRDHPDLDHLAEEMGLSAGH